MAADRNPPESDAPHDPILRLNALVDSELSAKDRATLAAEIAADRDLARAHATLARLKATLAAIGEADAKLPSAVAARPMRWRRPVAAAALAAFVAGAGLTAWLYGASYTAPQSPMAEPSHTIVRAAMLPADPVVPDLSVAGLKLGDISVEPDGTPSVTASYHGPRGCRLTLRIGEAESTRVPAGSSARRVWTAGGLTYELTAYGMETARFAAVAGTAEQAVRGLKPDSGVLRVARAASLPCVG